MRVFKALGVALFVAAVTGIVVGGCGAICVLTKGSPIAILFMMMWLMACAAFAASLCEGKRP